MPDRGYCSFARLIFLSLPFLAASEACAFGFEDVDARAKELAAAPFSRASSALPRELQGISYDQYRDIRFRRNRFLWNRARLPFEVAFFHPGWLYDQPVKISEIVDDKVREIKFDPESFEYGSNKIDPAKLRDLGFAGFRVHYSLNTPRFKDEVLVFLGASYLRALGKSQLYGLSARGLAIDPVSPAGEEFPRFTEFWLEKPAAGAEELTIYALLDSRRASGAYRFVLQPGEETVLEVKARLYLREKVGKLGIAPLTSMFSFGENQRAQREDYRPEVHDSDGLALQAGGGEWLWRPLVNPRRPLFSAFPTTSPRGFGLMQRDRDFGHYEDLEARYELRPSAWIEPKGKWGAGRVELVQSPAPDETSDNIVAYWVPENLPAPREPYDFEYRMRWQKDSDARPPHAWVVQTRRGHGLLRKGDTSIALFVDFAGPALRKLGRDAKVEAVVSADSNAQIIEREIYRHDVTGGWRMALRVRRLDEGKAVELRGFLRSGNRTLSETWSYLLPPN